MRISVFQSRELQATILALRGFDRELQGQVRRATREIGQPEWQAAVGRQASTQLERAVLVRTARLQVSNQNVTLRSAVVGRQLSRGGARPNQVYGGVEFGANHAGKGVTATSSRGRRYTYHRNTTAQFKSRRPTGYVVYPAAAKMIPRFAALWVATTVRTFHEAIEGRRG